MPSAIAEIIAEGSWVDLDLLTSIPTTTDLQSMAMPSWRGYRPVSSQIQAVARALPAGIQFRVQGQFLASEGSWEVAAVAASYRGSLLFVAPLEQKQIVSWREPFAVTIDGLFNGVLQ